MTAAVLCLLATGAWAAPAPAAIASCSNGAKGKCVEWRNLDATGTQAMKDLCATSKGEAVWSEGKPCTTKNRIATCTIEGLKSETVQNFYPPYTSDKAKAECAANPLGKFKQD
jgi:hypothetical protein